jgi:hypothetical protein
MIQWRLYDRKPGVWLRVNYDWVVNSVFRDDLEQTLDKELDDAGKWCLENKCGSRMAYDMFQFKTDAQRTAFLLKWS